MANRVHVRAGGARGRAGLLAAGDAVGAAAHPERRTVRPRDPGEPGGATAADDEGFAATTHRHRQLYLRKLFHLLATVMFLPVLVFEPAFLGLAFAGALAVFFVLELFRVTLVPPIGPAVADFMERFRDGKDPGPLLLTHIYLLLGCAIPVWLHQPGAAGYSTGIASLGIISIGVGDATASLAGTRYGRTKWPGTSKSLEGSTLSMASQAAVVGGLACLGYVTAEVARQMLVGFAVGTLFEAITLQSDNIIVPLLVYATAAAGVAAAV